MKRRFYDPGNLVSIFAGPKPQKVFAPSPQNSINAEKQAAQEASRKARAAAANRQGQRRTLLTTPGFRTSTLNTQRPSLLRG